MDEPISWFDGGASPHIGHLNNGRRPLAPAVTNGRAPVAMGIILDRCGCAAMGSEPRWDFLIADGHAVQRVGRIRSFRLPVAKVSCYEPRQTALALLYEAGLLQDAGAEEVVSAFSRNDYEDLLEDLVAGDLGVTSTSPALLLDAVASILGVLHRARYPGEAPVVLDDLMDPDESRAYLLHVAETAEGWVLDWEPLIQAVLVDRICGLPAPTVAARTINGIADGIARVAQIHDAPFVALWGDLLDNRRFREALEGRLKRQGQRVLPTTLIAPEDPERVLGRIAAAMEQQPSGLRNPNGGQGYAYA